MAITGDWASRPAFAQARFDGNPFKLGVASGDPSPTGVVLWTRLAPDPLAIGGGLPAEPYEVRFEVARDEGFHQIIRQGTTVALPDEAHIVFNNRNRGYARCTLTPEHWTTEYRKVTTVEQPVATASTLATFVVENGRAGAQLAVSPPS